ncbi:PREDICTED: F-box/LRR-repeat protein At3g60040-like [Camelina sativa]|uniref:F-box/LRR-repeat protein At3g60040-like n=1 Tax=Camelina sativa TaxID=90675 RepID=A0ABM1R3X9_CAMSA|nr:PREDICTED: F-box/LRR-repeat protein At3g60040-like [Camelina sativa]XP_019093718.1 PREDICTED: F-box/LRR-repeat protein At3g60040-like [Camelina sativa]
MRESFRDFVDRTLALQCGSSIKKFSLKCHIHDGDSKLAHVVRWVCNALARGVFQMDLSIKTSFQVLLPPELFTSKTLVKLRLGTQVCFGEIPPNVSLPALKILILESVVIRPDDMCFVLLPGCPVLEELYVYHDGFEGWPYRISSQTIKRLLVQYDEFDIESMSFMSIDAPNLLFLHYSHYALSDYPQVNLASLVEARLDIQCTKTIKRPDLTGLIMGISNVETLHLSPDSVDVISRCVRHGLLLPLFNNLVSLSFGSKNKSGWKLLPYLLEQSPKLETVIIQGMDSYTGDVTMRPLQVKVLRVLGYGGSAKELEHLKKFTGESECLEVVLVDAAEAVVEDAMYCKPKGFYC